MDKENIQRNLEKLGGRRGFESVAEQAVENSKKNQEPRRSEYARYGV